MSDQIQSETGKTKVEIESIETLQANVSENPATLSSLYAYLVELSKKVPPLPLQAIQQNALYPTAENNVYYNYGHSNQVITREGLKQMAIRRYESRIHYSKRYHDNENEYRHVILPRAIAEFLPSNKLLTEEEWRSYGLKQSIGWEHYMIHSPEPHILLFRREKDYQLKYPTAKEINSEGKLNEQEVSAE
ncbi:10635_t:CDS:2 [Paraglomus occultum]|uniref:Cyclin-dependent kinases regulatory subunit n=1 Tax=Paraglomus occultum TaxID=144539 RepID=A0A9N8WLG2_9GLOM|nr:10635_t:CDS:2 [Paraglomus occultum]